jgi:hypothetical protein
MKCQGLSISMPGVSRAGKCSLLAGYCIEAIACVASYKLLQVCYVILSSDR